MLKQAIEKLVERQHLTQEESALAIRDVLTAANPHQAAAFLMLMRAKGETVEELQGIIEAMRAAMVRVHFNFPVLDIVGTGGDGAHTLNISTASAILAASCGVKIAKHGNRSVSSLAGSADVLEAMGIDIHQTPEQIQRSVEQLGIGFMFAPNFHPALKQIKEVRKGLNTRTFFNLIGPLLNPAGAEHLMIGVSSESWIEIAAALLQRLNVRRSLVFNSCGLDELSTLGPARVIEVSEGSCKSFVLDPQQLGLKHCTIEDLRGRDAHYNAEKLLATFAGEESGFADTIALNAGVAAYLYGITTSIPEGIVLAKTHLREKRALHFFIRWKTYG